MNEAAKTLVSMVIPCFNHERFVTDCISSVIAQTHEELELLVIDDGSSDDSVAKIRAKIAECEARFVRFEFRHRSNKGLSATVDEGLRWARGDFFATLASDDVLLPGKTSSMLEHLKRDEALAGVFGGYELIDEDGRLLETWQPTLEYPDFDDLLLRRGQLVAAPTQLLRTDALLAVGGYSANIFIEDWYMWLKLSKSGYGLKLVPDVVVQYRQHASNISKDAIRMYEARIQILADYVDYPNIHVALARASLMASIDLSSASKRKCLSYLVKAARMDPGIVFTEKFVGGLARLLVPTPMLRLRHSLKAAVRSRGGP